jgi:hypothetical protein
LWQRLDLGREGVADQLDLVALGQVHEHRVAGRALDQGADRRQVALADDQVVLPNARARRDRRRPRVAR